MGVASLVLGIVAITIAWIPGCGWITFIPAIVGLILGIIDIGEKRRLGLGKGMAIAGMVLSAISLGFNVMYFIMVVARR